MSWATIARILWFVVRDENIKEICLDYIAKQKALEVKKDEAK